MELSGYAFERVCDIDPERTDAGVVAVHTPQADYANRDESAVHDDGWGPFCAFDVPEEGTRRPAVYVVAVEDDPVYVGQTRNLYERFADGYGRISPADCFEDGQATDCRLNTAILHAVRAGDRVSLLCHATDDFAGSDAENRTLRRLIAADLVDALSPPWNRTESGGARSEGESPRTGNGSSRAGSDEVRAGSDGGRAGNATADGAPPVDAGTPATREATTANADPSVTDADPSTVNADQPVANADAPPVDAGSTAATPDASPVGTESPDRPTGEFEALYDYLASHERDRVERSFAELEVVLDAALPTEARRWRRWWTNDERSHPHSRFWLRAGYEVASASLPDRRVTFERRAGRASAPGVDAASDFERPSPR